MLTPLEIVQRATGLVDGLVDRPAHADGPARRAPRVPFALLVGGLLVGGLALLLALNTASAANELERHGLATKDADVAARVQDLKVRAARSAAPENLARAAADLGMVPAGNPAFVVIGPNGTATVLGKPKRATEAPVIVPKPTTPKPTSTSSTSSAPTAPPTTEPPTGTAPPTTPPTTAPPTGTPPRTTPARTTPARTPVRTPTTRTSTPTPVITLPGGTR